MNHAQILNTKQGNHQFNLVELDSQHSAFHKPSTKQRPFMKISACLLMTLRSEEAGSCFWKTLFKGKFWSEDHHNHHVNNVNMSKLRNSVHEEGHLRQKKQRLLLVPSIEAFRMQENKQIIQASADLDSKSQSCPKIQQKLHPLPQNQEFFVAFPC